MLVRIRYTDGREQVVELDPHRTLKFGTRRSADVVLEGGGIFPVHFGILLHHGAFTVVASEQARKISVNGARVHEAALHAGDRIEVGGIVVTVEEQAARQPSAGKTAATSSGGQPGRAARTVWLARLGLASAVLPLAVLLGVYVGQLPTADELRQRAEDAYRQQDYALAVVHFDAYLRTRPGDPERSRARTKRDLAMWLSRPEADLEAAALVDEIATASVEWSSDESVSVSDALAELLPPAIRQLTRLAQAAQETDGAHATESPVVAAQTGLDLLSTYLSLRQQQDADIDRMQADVLRLQRERDAEPALNRTLSALEQAAARTDWDAARSARESLLSTYPHWVRDARLRDAWQHVATKLAARVEILKSHPQVVPHDPADHSWLARVQLVKSSVALRDEAAPTTSAGTSPPLCVYHRGTGTVWGVDARHGRPLSRTSIGIAGPATVCELVEGECLLANAIEGDVRRVNLATGEVRWRLPLRGDALATSVDGTSGAVLSSPNVVSLVSLTDGTMAWQTRFPQALSVAPVFDPKLPLCYVVADDSQVFVLSRETGECLSVCATGHGPGTVWTRPMLVGDYLVIAEQVAAELTAYHVLRRGNTLELVQTLEAAGALASQPLQVGNVIYLPSDHGIAERLQFHPDDARKPFTPIEPWTTATAHTPGRKAEHWTSVGDRLCVAGSGIRLFRAAADPGVPLSVAEFAPELIALGPACLQGDRLFMLGSLPDPCEPTFHAWDLERQSMLWSVTWGPAIQGTVSLIVDVDAIQIQCGAVVYRLPRQHLASSAGPLLCVDPIDEQNGAAASAVAQVDLVKDSLTGPIPANLTGRTFRLSDEGLVCQGADQTLLWQFLSRGEPFVGACFCSEQEIAVADVSGRVYCMGAELGEYRRELTAVGARLQAGPWRIDSHLAVLTQDGCLLVWE